MKIEKNNLENLMFEYFEQIKALISPGIWESVLFDCSKNELLVLVLLYRNSDVNMSEVAEYAGVPLNTATGIITRMEKKQMVERIRSTTDKRVVTIVLTPAGKKQIQDIMKEFLRYGEDILEALTLEELALTGRILDKVTEVLKSDRKRQILSDRKTIKKITID